MSVPLICAFSMEPRGYCPLPDGHRGPHIGSDLLAAAWDEGHRTRQQLGPDGCRCAAYNEGECGCGRYGSNIVTPNPYRRDAPGYRTEWDS